MEISGLTGGEAPRVIKTVDWFSLPPILFFVSPLPFLPRRHQDPGNPGHQEYADSCTIWVEIFPDRPPFLPDFHPGPRRCETPRPGPKKRVDINFPGGHESDPR